MPLCGININFFKNKLKRIKKESKTDLMQKNQLHQSESYNQWQSQYSQILKEDLEKELSKSKLVFNTNQARSQNQRINQAFSRIQTQSQTLNKKQSSIMKQIQKQQTQAERLKVGNMTLEKTIRQIKKHKGVTTQIKHLVSSIAQKDNTQFKFINVQKTWQQIQNIEEISPVFARLICDNYMNNQLFNLTKILDQSLLNQLKAKAQTNPISVENVIVTLVSLLEQNGSCVFLQESSTIQSQLTLKYLVGGLLNNAVMVYQTISDYDQTCPFKFDQLSDEKVFRRFDSWYRDKISKQTGINYENIVIHSVVKGSIKVQWSTDQAAKLDVAVKDSPQLQKRYQIQPFLQTFNVSPQDFDARGDIKFKEVKNDVEFRGGWPYYQPVKCKRFGLDVSKKYDQGNDRWLQMKGQPGEWAVGFHGINQPEARCSNGMKIFDSIMSGREKGEMLKEGSRQAYALLKSLNKPNLNVGRGVYLAPHFQTSLKEYTSNTQNYVLIFQCRINSKQIKVCENNIYWVINKSKDVRPYGIILVEKSVKDSYPSIQKQFKKEFVYTDFKDKIESYLKSFK